MSTFHIHIKGIVQGVGFRPFVYRLALKHRLKGTVNNTTDGVHIHINTGTGKARLFLAEIRKNLPPLAVITHATIKKIRELKFTDFQIIHSGSEAPPNLLLTPDVAMCDDCRKDIFDPANRRFQYPFTTCTNCGPRYSITAKLPYDRVNTTMDVFKMCPRCENEYNDLLNRRHYSQTNSCPDCRIRMQWYENGRTIEDFTDLGRIAEAWEAGKIVAIKGIGGYLLTCDASNKQTVSLLRKRKNRPAKPFALMYPDIQTIKKDVVLHPDEIEELQAGYAPIVLLRIRREKRDSAAFFEINKGLSELGIMLPYTPLYAILLQKFGKPIVATSGNLTGSSIIFDDEKAKEELTRIADILLMNNREILLPQDDGVVRFTQRHRQKIVIRRSRGKAPGYINKKLAIPNKSVFASGAMLKSAFGIIDKTNLYVSQYLGNTEGYEAQLNYEKTFDHFRQLFRIKFDRVVADLHPGYFATRFAEKLALENQIPVIKVQHHKAHFLAVLGEHDLLNTDENILGVVWDGTGLGEDGNIWGGEFFMYNKRKTTRVAHLEEFPFITGDKMVREPRISALALFHSFPEAEACLKPKFKPQEWHVYQRLLKNTKLKSSSAGRLFDAVASLLFGFDVHSFEAEAAMQLENEVLKYLSNGKTVSDDSYLYQKELPLNFMDLIRKSILTDLKKGVDRRKIAYKFYLTLSDYILKTAEKYRVSKVAFSGGVFQNAVFTDLIIDRMQERFELYFHKEFSPNDECIPFGQLMFSVTEAEK